MKTANRVIRINIVSWDSGGLGIDIDVLTQALTQAGCEVSFKGRRYRKPQNRIHGLLMTVGVILAQRLAGLTRRPPFDINFFIESIFPEYLVMGRVNCLFVNPEWFRDANYAHLSRIDLLLCKTPNGVEAFHDLPVPCRDVGFTSPDKRISGFVRRGPVRCLHLSGQSAVKGSEVVVEAWSHHPEWPELTVVRRARRYGGGEAPPLPALPNVRYETGYLPDDQLRQLQNECEIHVIPSQAEAYGHVIGEAMGCGAVVVTTDAPPMNELVGPDRGVLVRVCRSEPMHRSMRNYVDIEDLEMKLGEVFAMAPGQRAEIGKQARAWYEAQHAHFENALGALVDELYQAVVKQTM